MHDLDELALAMPETTKEVSDDGRPAYLVHGKRFCLQRGRRSDAIDPETGERLDDVLMFRVDGPALLALAQRLEYIVIGAIGVPLLMLALAAIAGNMVQHRLVWSGESLKPKLSKISPAAGATRIFGKQAAANFAKGIFKLVALGAVMAAVLWPERHRLESMVRIDPASNRNLAACSFDRLSFSRETA